MIGKVIYSSGGNYKVSVGKKIYFTKPIGIFRKNNIKIIVGDFVELNVKKTFGQDDQVSIIKLLPRKNFFIRPNVSNIDNIIIVTSVLEPKLNDYFLDKLITIFQFHKLKPILLFTKTDLNYSDDLKEIINIYKKINYVNFSFSNEENKIELKKFLNSIKGQTSAFVGQTGVGKSSLLNKIDKNLNLPTQEISKSLGRGKHTTRHLEMFEIYKDTFIIDTPGFSSLTIDSKLDISKNFLNFSLLSEKCKFKNCMHIHEEDCNVKKNTNPKKYNNYLKLIKEIEKR